MIAPMSSVEEDLTAYSRAILDEVDKKRALFLPRIVHIQIERIDGLTKVGAAMVSCRIGSHKRAD